MTPAVKEQLSVLLVHAAVVFVVIIAATVLAFGGKIDPQSAAVILSTALGFSGGRAASVSTRHRSTDTRTASNGGSQ